ncbi:hypothetical protein ACVBIL_07255 [Shewanella sp. 125m-7]
MQILLTKRKEFAILCSTRLKVNKLESLSGPFQVTTKGTNMLDSSKPKSPPLPLIQTWIWMMTQSGNPEIQEKGQSNLIASFGSLAKANEYLLEQDK